MAGRRWRGISRGRMSVRDPADCVCAGVGRGSASRTRRECVSHLAENHGGRGGRGRAPPSERFKGRRVGLILCGGSIDLRVFSGHRSWCASWSARTKSCRSATIPDAPCVIADRLRPARRQHSRGRSPPAVSRRARQGRQARRRWRRETPRMPTRLRAHSPRTAIVRAHRCGAAMKFSIEHDLVRKPVPTFRIMLYCCGSGRRLLGHRGPHALRCGTHPGRGRRQRRIRVARRTAAVCVGLGRGSGGAANCGNRAPRPTS